MSESITITQEQFDNYRSGHLNRVYGIPIIKDGFEHHANVGSPAEWHYRAPDRIIGYRFYVEQNGQKWIMETRADQTSNYNLYKMWFRDWDEKDVLKSHVDVDDRLEP